MKGNYISIRNFYIYFLKFVQLGTRDKRRAYDAADSLCNPSGLSKTG